MPVAVTAAVLLLPASAAAGIPGVHEEPLGHALSRIVGVDDAGRVTLVVADGEHHRLLRREADGRRTTLLDRDQRLSEVRLQGGPPRIAAATNAAGDTVVAWHQTSSDGDSRCAPACVVGMHVAVARAGGALDELGVVPVADGAIVFPEARIAARGDAEVVWREEPRPRRVTVRGRTLVEPPVDRLDGVVTIEGTDGTRYAVDGPFSGPSTLHRRAAGEDGWLAAPVGLGGAIDDPPVLPLPNGRAVVVGRADDQLASVVVQPDGAAGAPRPLGVRSGLLWPLRRQPASTPGGGAAAVLRVFGDGPSQGDTFRVVTADPQGAVTVHPWPGPAPGEASLAVDRGGALTVVETFGDRRAPQAARVRRFAPWGGEEGSADLPGARADDVRTSSTGALAVAAERPGGVGSLLVRPPDREPPVLAGRALAARGNRSVIDVRLRCDEGCEVPAGRLVSPPGARRVAPPLATAAPRAGAGVRLPPATTARVRVRLTAAQRRAVRRAHRSGRSARVVLRVVARDALRNATAKRFVVRVRPPARR